MNFGMKGTINSVLTAVLLRVGANILLMHQAIFTPIVYDLYKHDVNKKAFTSLLVPYVLSYTFHIDMSLAEHGPSRRTTVPHGHE
ncbi:hypothetical protein QQ045_029095 [Rhodiola kirilowii]